MANITRIKNNQVTDNTIEYQKLKDGTLVGSKFNANLTLNSNVTILGNLTVANSFAQLNSINTYINDPLVVFNNNYTGSPTYDIGMLINRNLSSLAPYGAVNAAFVWKEADNAFEALMTTETGTTAGSINNTGWANVKLGNLHAVSATIEDSLSAGVANFASINNTPIGNATPAIGSFTNLTAVDGFQTANAVINGGYISTLTNAHITTATLTNATATNFYSGNIFVDGGYIDHLANIAADLGYITNLNSTNGNVTTLQVNNLNSGNAVISGGYISALANIGAVYGTFTNLGSGNAVITGGNLTGLTKVEATTALATNFSTGNAVITGGYISAVANIGAVYGTFTNLASGNAVITGGNLTGLTKVETTTAKATNFSTGNAVITGGSVNGLTDFTATTAQATNFSTGNATITGAQTYIGTGLQPIANAYVTTGYFTNLSASNVSLVSENVTTLYAQNFSSPNAVVTGGSVNGSPIGASSASTGAFTTLTASGATTLTNSTQSTTASTGALIVTGGVGIAKNLNVGGDALVTGNLTVQGTMTAIQSQTLDVTDLNITVAKGAVSAAAANGAGLTVDGASATLLYTSATDSWNVNKQLIGTGASFSNTTPSTSSATGALVVAGGAGIAGDLYAYRVNTTYGNITTGYFGSLNTANAVISGGYISAVANIGAVYGTFTNLGSGNAVITGGSLTGLTNVETTTAKATNFSTGNAVITGGYVTGLANATATYGTFTNLNSSNVLISGGSISGLTNLASTTSVATNFSSGNAVITGGSINGTVIGNTTPAAATFTQLNTTGATYLGGNIVANSGTTSTNTTTGAIVVTGLGGLAVGGNIHAGVYETSLHNIRGNLLLGLGTSQAIDSELTINLNTTDPLPSAAIVHVSGSPNKNSFYGLDSFGTGTPGVSLRRARGTPAAPTATQAEDVLGRFAARGYGATGYRSDTQSSFTVYANENFTDTAQGTYAAINVIPNGDTVPLSRLKVYGNGSTLVAGTVSSTTPSTGALIVTGGAGIGGNLTVGGQLDINGTSLFEQRSTFMGNVVANSSVNSTSIDTGALVVVGGVGVYSNVFIGGATVFNANYTAGYDTIVHGDNDSTLIWARADSNYDQVLIGNSATASTLVRGAKLQINSTDSILLPVGTNAQRPSNSGGTDVTGMFRYSTTASGLEYYNGTQWQGITTQFTVIVDEQFNGDGVTVNFTMLAGATTASTIVSINGVIQIPTLAYSVGGVDNKTLTFTEAPAAGDVVDVRRLTTTQTVSSIASVNGYMQLVTDNNGVYVYTGASGTSPTTSWIANGQEISNAANVSVSSANTATTIDSMDNTKYRTAQYLVQVTHGTDYQAQTVTLIQNGTSVFFESHGVLYSNGNLGVVSAAVNGSNSELKFIASNTNTIVKVSTKYITI